MATTPSSFSSHRSTPCSLPSASTSQSAPDAHGHSVPAVSKKGSLEMALNSSAHAHIAQVLDQPQMISGLNWRLGHFLHRFCEYFHATFKGTKFEWLNGVHYLTGKDFWKTVLQEKFRAESLDDLQDPNCWSFCTEPPANFDIHLTLPSVTIHPEQLDLFCNFCAYLIVIESSGRPPNYHTAILEFSRLVSLDVNALEDQSEQMQIISKMNQVRPLIASELYPMKIEIPLSNNRRLRLLLSHLPPERPEEFSLTLLPDSHQLSSRLVCYTSPMRAAVNILERLSPTKERALAYRLNAYHLWEDASQFSGGLSEADVQALTPLGRFLNTHTDPQRSAVKEASAVLTICGLLRLFLTDPTQSSPRVKRDQSHLMVTWKTDSSRLHLMLPSDPETILDQLYQWLQKDPKACVSCLSQGLSVFFPNLAMQPSKVPPVPLQEKARHQAMSLCQALKSEPIFARSALVWLTCLTALGWKEITEDDLLELTDMLSSFTDRQTFDRVLQALEVGYVRTPYGPLFRNIQNRLKELDPLSPEAVRSICLQELMVSREPKVVPAAWKRFHQAYSAPAEALPFLREMCPRLGMDAVVLAIPQICTLCNPEGSTINRQERFQLLSSYLDHLLGLSTNGHERESYAPVLRDLIVRTIGNKSNLRSRLTPRVLDYISPPKAAAESSAQADQTEEKENVAVQAEAEEIPDESERVWEALLQAKELHNGAKEFPRVIVDFEGHLSGFGREFASKRGFTTFVKWALGILEGQKEYQRMLTILRYVPHARNDHFVSGCYQTCLERLSQQKVSADVWTGYAAQLREAGVTVSQEVLLSLFESVVKTAAQESKLKDPKVRRELKALHDRLKPDGKAAPRFAECIVTYYSTLMEPGFASQLLEDLIRHLSMLKGRAAPLASQLVEVLKGTPRDAKLWDRFSQLVDRLASAPADVLGIYEALTADAFIARASINDPPLQMIRKRIGTLAQSLTDAQKPRLAKVLCALTAVAQREKKEAELMGGFPSVPVFLGYLQYPETWDLFVRLFFDLIAKKKIDPKHSSTCSMLLWMAPRIYDAEAVRDFRAAVARIPSKDLQPPASWRPVLRALLARNVVDPEAPALLASLIAHAEPPEKKFLEDCQRRLARREDLVALQSRLKTYQETGVVPAVEVVAIAPDSRAELAALLAKPNPDIEKALTLIEQCSGPEFELWMKIFQHLPPGKYRLYAKTWKLWLQKHSPAKAQASESAYWLRAIRDCWAHMDSQDFPVYDHFIIHHALILLLRLNPESRREICKLVLIIGIHSAWEQGVESPIKKIEALFHIVESKNLAALIGDPMALLDEEARIRLNLLLVRSSNQEIRRAGNVGFVTMVTVHDILDKPASRLNYLLFDNYCTYPYVTGDAIYPPILYRWIEQCWPVMKSTLTWCQSLNLISMLCRFECPEFQLSAVFGKWVETVSGTREQQPAVKVSATNILTQMLIPKDYDALEHNTRTLFEQIWKSKELPEDKKELPEDKKAEEIARVKCDYFIRANFQLKIFIGQNYPKEKIISPPLLLHLAAGAFNNLPKFPGAMRIALEDLMKCLPNTPWNDDCKQATAAFITALPTILELVADGTLQLTQVESALRSLLEINNIRHAAPEEDHSWVSVLYCLAVGVQEAPRQHQRAITRSVLRTFAFCTNPVSLKTVKTLTVDDNKTVRLVSCNMLANCFLCLLELGCLEPDDWTLLFQDISMEAIQEMIKDLTAKDQNENKKKALLNCISMARLIQHAKPVRLEFLGGLWHQLQTMGTSLLQNFNPQEDVIHQLGVRYVNIHAATALIKKYAGRAPGVTQEVTALRNKLIGNFIGSFLSMVKDEESFKKYEFIFLEALVDADQEVAKKMHEAFVVPSELTPEIRDKLNFLKTGVLEHRMRS